MNDSISRFLERTGLKLSLGDRILDCVSEFGEVCEQRDLLSALPSSRKSSAECATLREELCDLLFSLLCLAEEHAEKTIEVSETRSLSEDNFDRTLLRVARDLGKISKYELKLSNYGALSNHQGKIEGECFEAVTRAIGSVASLLGALGTSPREGIEYVIEKYDRRLGATGSMGSGG